jgi:ParB family chromosome partitioning protein
VLVTPEAPAPLYESIPTAAIVPNPAQPRRFFDAHALDELAASLRQFGLMQPLVVRPVGDGVYRIIAGERRWRAAQLAGLEALSCRVLADISDVDAFILSVTENVARRDMTMIEEGHAYAAIVALGREVADVAALFGKEPWAIQWRIDLLNLREDLQELVARGQLNLNLARNLSRLSLAGQGTVMRRYTAGEFATADVANRFALALIATEAQADLFQPVDPEDVFEAAGAARRRATLKGAWEGLAETKLATVLDAFLEMDPAQIALALGPDTAVYRARFDELHRHLGKVKTALAQANALHLASLALAAPALPLAG